MSLLRNYQVFLNVDPYTPSALQCKDFLQAMLACKNVLYYGTEGLVLYLVTWYLSVDSGIDMDCSFLVDIDVDMIV